MTGRRLMVATVAMLAGAVLLGCSGDGKVSKDNFDKIQIGMTMEEVQDILGEGEKGSAGFEFGDAEMSGAVYTWAEGDKRIVVTFKDGKVIQKMQTGL